MKIEKRKYKPTYQAVLFNVSDGGEWFVCAVLGGDLDRDLLIGSEQAERIFDARENEILEAAIPVIWEAKENGIQHHRGFENTPLVVRLSPRH